MATAPQVGTDPRRHIAASPKERAHQEERTATLEGAVRQVRNPTPVLDRRPVAGRRHGRPGTSRWHSPTLVPAIATAAPFGHRIAVPERLHRTPLGARRDTVHFG